SAGWPTAIASRWSRSWGAVRSKTMTDPLMLAGKPWRSRLIVGTGKYRDENETRRAIAASGAEIVTVALRRVELKPGQPSLLDALSGYALLPNTAGCYTADEAVR